MATLTQRSNWLLRIEFFLICVCIPTFIIVEELARHMFAFLWGVAIIAWILYRRTPKDPEERSDEKGLWRWDLVTKETMKPMLIRFVISAIGLTIFTYAYAPERAFVLVREHPEFWLILLFIYPILSALPQEFIFCTFFFRRYASFFKTETAMIIASAVVFAYAHVLFINWVAPLLSLIAGYFFAQTYAKHKSLALVTIEHGLYGNWLFTTGMGWYFYGGAV